MTAIKLIQEVKNGGVFIPLEGFDNQVVEVEVSVNSMEKVKIKNNAAAIAQSFFSKMDRKDIVNLDKLSVYEQ